MLLDIGYKGRFWTFEKKFSGGSFTRCRLDRALVSAEWLALFPLASLTHLTAAASDYAPILLELKEVAKGRFLPGNVMHSGNLYESVWRVSLLRVFPIYEKLTVQQNSFEEDEEPWLLADCFVGYLKWPAKHILIDKPSPNRTLSPTIHGIGGRSPSPNIPGVGSPPGRSPLGLFHPVSAKDVLEDHMLEES